MLCWDGGGGRGDLDSEHGAGRRRLGFWGVCGVGWLALLRVMSGGGSGRGGCVLVVDGVVGSSLLSIATRNAMGKQTPFT